MYEMLTGESPFYSDDIPKMYNSIQKSPLSIPKTISENARNLITVSHYLEYSVVYIVRNYLIVIQTKDQGLRTEVI